MGHYRLRHLFLVPSLMSLARRPDGGVDVQGIHFTMTAPRFLDPDEPVPVVIFGHAIMTESRMVLAIGDALAQRGFVAVSVDLPMHGTRTHCWTEGPLSIPDPTTGELTTVANPCAAGDTCNDEGKCVDALGIVQPFAEWPVLNMPMEALKRSATATSNDSTKTQAVPLRVNRIRQANATRPRPSRSERPPSTMVSAIPGTATMVCSSPIDATPTW